MRTNYGNELIFFTLTLSFELKYWSIKRNTELKIVVLYSFSYDIKYKI